MSPGHIVPVYANHKYPGDYYWLYKISGIDGQKLSGFYLEKNGDENFKLNIAQPYEEKIASIIRPKKNTKRLYVLEIVCDDAGNYVLSKMVADLLTSLSS